MNNQWMHVVVCAATPSNSQDRQPGGMFWKRRTIAIAALCKYNMCAAEFAERWTFLEGEHFARRSNSCNASRLTLPKSPAVAGLLLAILRRGADAGLWTPYGLRGTQLCYLFCHLGRTAGSNVVDARVTEMWRRLPSTLRNRRRRRTAGISSDAAGSSV